MTDHPDLGHIHALYQVMPGERIQYAPTIDLPKATSTPPASTRADYDVIVALTGGGAVTWSDQHRPLTRGGYVAVPPEATYSVHASADTDLTYMLLGIASDPDPAHT